MLSMYFCYFAITVSPLGGRRGAPFKQIWILFTQQCFVPSLVETSRLVLKKKTLKCYQIVSAILLLKFYQDRPNMVSKEECTNFVQCMNTYNRDRSSMLLQCNLAYSKIVALANISKVISDVRFIADFWLSR